MNLFKSIQSRKHNIYINLQEQKGVIVEYAYQLRKTLKLLLICETHNLKKEHLYSSTMDIVLSSIGLKKKKNSTIGTSKFNLPHLTRLCYFCLKLLEMIRTHNNKLT